VIFDGRKDKDLRDKCALACEDAGMVFEQIVIYFVLPAVGYLLGSIPFAFVIGKLHGVDIRTVGSKNIGATNLGRTLGMMYFWQAFILDAAKGFVPVLVAALLIRHWNELHYDVPPTWYPLPSWPPILTGGLCMLGHLFPVWLGFKGGKGVATGFGVVLGFWPLFTLAGVVGGLFFVFMLMVYRYISLASMSSSVVFVMVVAGLGNLSPKPAWMPVETYLPWPQLWPLLIVAGIFSLLIIIRHRGNVVRLMKGTEPKVGMGRKDIVHPKPGETPPGPANPDAPGQ